MNILFSLVQLKNTNNTLKHYLSTQDSLFIMPFLEEVLSRLVKYLDRICQNGSLTLKTLAQLEVRIVSDFKLTHFGELPFGGFIDFLLDTDSMRHYIEEHGGSLMGGSFHAGSTDCSYSVRAEDLCEFIRQCGVRDQASQSVLENALCQHYAAKEVRSLGHGTLSKLLKATEKVQPGRATTIFYQTALAAKQLSGSMSQDRTVGVLGHVTKEQALSCLQNCPLLEDLATWSQWNLVFKPELKDLKDFIVKHGGMCTTIVTSK